MDCLPDSLQCGKEIYKARSGYENILCKELGWQIEKNTDYDATYEGIKIEIKKGNTWLNVRRYAKLFIKGRDAYSNDITAIFTKDTKKETIGGVYFLKTAVIIETALKLDKNISEKIIELDKHWRKCEDFIGKDNNNQVNFKVSAYKHLSFCHKIFE